MLADQTQSKDVCPGRSNFRGKRSYWSMLSMMTRSTAPTRHPQVSRRAGQIGVAVPVAPERPIASDAKALSSWVKMALMG